MSDARNDEPRHLSALALDTLALGGLSAADAATAEAHLAGCARCRRDADEARAAREHFASRVLLRTLPARAPRRRRWPWLTLVAAPSLALAAALLLVVPRALHSREDDAIAVKGGPSLQLFARRAGRVFAVVDGARLAAGDEVRFAVTPAGLGYLLVASVDGAGHATVYFPYGGTASAPVDAEARSELPGSIVLDAAPGPERVFALFSRAPLSAADATRALRALGARGADAIRAQRRLPVAAEAQLSIWFDKAP